MVRSPNQSMTPNSAVTHKKQLLCLFHNIVDSLFMNVLKTAFPAVKLLIFTNFSLLSFYCRFVIEAWCLIWHFYIWYTMFCDVWISIMWSRAFILFSLASVCHASTFQHPLQPPDVCSILLLDLFSQGQQTQLFCTTATMFSSCSTTVPCNICLHRQVW